MLSVASERAVELLKNLYLKKLNAQPVHYQLLSGIVGSVLCYFSPPTPTVIQMNFWVTVIATGLAVSSGSAFWNSLLDTLAGLSKNLKSLQTPK
jgi:hypothetical protein